MLSDVWALQIFSSVTLSRFVSHTKIQFKEVGYLDVKFFQSVPKVCPETVPGWAGKTVLAAMEDVRASLDENDLANAVQELADKLDFILASELIHTTQTSNGCIQEADHVK